MVPKYPFSYRGKCFSIVAAAVKDDVPDSIVDLKCREVTAKIRT